MSPSEFRLFCLFFVMVAVAVVPSLARNIASEDEDPEGGDEVLLTRIPWNTDEDGEETNEIGDDVNPESPFPEPDEHLGGNEDDEIDETGDEQGPLDAEEDLDEESVGGGPKPDIPEDGNNDDDGDDDDDDDDDDGGSVDETDKEVKPDILGGISFFDSAVFNLGRVTQYFHDMEAWLKNVLRQTIDEALLMNGTFSNTTEEEVDIDGNKYIVHKSIIRGGDNESSIYVETLSSKRKEGENGMEIRNETEIISTSR